MDADGFVPHHALVTAEGAAPEQWMLVSHGILGSGTNLRGLARRLAAACPAWGFVLVDLRLHGQSQGAPPPHTIAAAAGDLVRLERRLALPIAGALGHSFGGKVALAYAAARGGGLDQLWVLDASPGTRRERGGTTEAVLAMLRGIEQPLPSRERFLAIVAEHGHPPAIAEWLAMNVRRAEDGFRIRLDLPAIASLLDDYFAADLFPVVERPSIARALHVVVGGRSDAVDAADRARLAAIAARSPHLRVHVIEGAGHWIHVEAPDALFALLRAELQAISTITGA